jgi:hypothetical protein
VTDNDAVDPTLEKIEAREQRIRNWLESMGIGADYLPPARRNKEGNLAYPDGFWQLFDMADGLLRADQRQRAALTELRDRLTVLSIDPIERRALLGIVNGALTEQDTDAIQSLAVLAAYCRAIGRRRGKASTGGERNRRYDHDAICRYERELLERGVDGAAERNRMHIRRFGISRRRLTEILNQHGLARQEGSEK